MTEPAPRPKSFPEIKPSAAGATDPVAVIFSDPEGHLSDLLYLHFRLYKKRLLWRFWQEAVTALQLKPEQDLAVADIGASTGHDLLYLLRRWSQNFRQPFPCRSIKLAMVEGDQDAIVAGTKNLTETMGGQPVSFEYFNHPMVEGLPLPEASQDVVLCSEVVEHLEHPEKLLAEIWRVLKPGGFCALTTDNSPNLFQRIRRLPVWLSGKYAERYARPDPAVETYGHTQWQGRDYPIYGHISLHPTAVWEKFGREVGFELVSFGTYESIRRGGAGRTPFKSAAYLLLGAISYYLLPARWARHLGDTTALLWRKPSARTG